jgi:hypothetical protein
MWIWQIFFTHLLIYFGLQGELEHRRVKRFYARTNKCKTFGHQISKHQRREQILKKIRERGQQLGNSGQSITSTVYSPAPNVSFEESDPLPKTPPEVHHHISNTTRLRENIYAWVDHHAQNNDEAVKVRLEHLLVSWN